MLGSLRDALVSAGAPEDKAAKAAEEVAGYENRLNGLEMHLAGIEGRLAGVERQVSILQWMVGLNMAMTLGTLWKVLTL
jgi:phage shock protein A